MGVSTPKSWRRGQQHPTTRRSQGYCPMRQKDHHSNTHSCKQDSSPHMQSMVVEYCRATASFTRLQAITSGNNNQGPAPMDIGATWHNNGKGQRTEGQVQRQRKAQQRQRLRRLQEQLRLQQLQRRKRRAQSTTGWTRTSFQSTIRIGKGKGGKGAKGKQAANDCYRWGQPGQFAKQCRVAIMQQLALPQPAQLAELSAVPLSGHHR